MKSAYSSSSDKEGTLLLREGEVEENLIEEECEFSFKLHSKPQAIERKHQIVNHAKNMFQEKINPKWLQKERLKSIDENDEISAILNNKIPKKKKYAWNFD